MKTLCSKLYLTWAIKTQNRAQYQEASITLDGVTLADSLIRWSPNEWHSVCWGIPQCLPIRRSEKLPGHLIRVHNEHSVYILGKPETYNLFITDYGFYSLYLHTTARNTAVPSYTVNKIFHRICMAQNICNHIREHNQNHSVITAYYTNAAAADNSTQ
jgi:hypothetical protein